MQERIQYEESEVWWCKMHGETEKRSVFWLKLQVGEWVHSNLIQKDCILLSKKHIFSLYQSL